MNTRVSTAIKNSESYFDQWWPLVSEELGTPYYNSTEGSTNPFEMALDKFCMIDYQCWDLESRVIGLSVRCQTGPNYRSYSFRIPSEVIKLREFYLGNRQGAQYHLQAYFSTDGELLEVGLIKTNWVFVIINAKPDWLYQKPGNADGTGNNRFWVLEWQYIEPHVTWRKNGKRYIRTIGRAEIADR